MNDVDDDRAAFMNYEEGGGVIISSLSVGLKNNSGMSNCSVRVLFLFKYKRCQERKRVVSSRQVSLATALHPRLIHQWLTSQNSKTQEFLFPSRFPMYTSRANRPSCDTTMGEKSRQREGLEKRKKQLQLSLKSLVASRGARCGSATYTTGTGPPSTPFCASYQ